MSNYEDREAIKIPVEKHDCRHFARGDWDGFTTVDEIEDEGYKDLAPVTTILARISDNTYWEFNWEKCTSYYGSGDSYYDNDPYLYKVDKIEKVVTRTEVTWEKVKP
jgi:hypothetical protein